MEYPEQLINKQYESSLVQYLIDAPIMFSSIGGVIDYRDFYYLEYATVFDILQKAFFDKKRVGRIILEKQLKQIKLETAWLYDKSGIKQSDEIKTIALQLSELSRKRNLYKAAEETKNSLLKDDLSINKVSTDLISGIIDSNRTDTQAELPVIFEKLKEEMKSIHSGKKLKPGFETMDLILPPFIPGHIIIVGAFTSTGKSFFALQLTKNIIEQEGYVAFFSTEMSDFENMGRLLGNQFEKGYQSLWQAPKIENSFLGDVKVKDYLGKISPYLRIYDNKRSIQEISLECRNLVFQKKLDIVVIDFIQNIDIGNRDTYEGMRKVALEIQRIAKDLKVTIILTSQLSNSYAKQGGNASTIEYKNAGELAASADVGIILHDARDKYEATMLRPGWKLPIGVKPIMVDIKKSRHTSGGKIPMFIEFPAGKVYEVPAKYDWYNTDRRSDYWASVAQQENE